MHPKKYVKFWSAYFYKYIIKEKRYENKKKETFRRKVV